MAWADDPERDLTPLKRAASYRNGLMIALLAVCPIRIRNFAGLEIGRHLIALGQTWHIALGAHETKEGRVDERPVIPLLSPCIERYLAHHRPVFKVAGTALWGARKGTVLTRETVAQVITETTRTVLGKALSPHLFRACAASTAYVLAGATPHLASALLNHRDPKTTEDHCNRTRAITFNRKFNNLLTSIRR